MVEKFVLIDLNLIPSLGNDLIDMQHNAMVDSINKLYAAIKNKKSEKELKKIVNFLEKYTIEHFSFEEEYFDNFEFLESNSHKEKHEWFKEQVNAIKEKVFSGEDLEVFAEEVIKVLANWFFDHISVEDKKYADFVKNKNK